MRRTRLSVVVSLVAIVAVLVLAPVSLASPAQPPAKDFRPGTGVPGPAVDVGPNVCDEYVQDGSFEAGTPNPFWNEFSSNFGTPLCDTTSCGTGGGTAGPHTANWWSWFGGIAAPETGDVSQQVTLPLGTATLTFWLWTGAASGNGVDDIRALMDGTPVFTALENDPTYTAGYVQVTVDVSAYADGGTHLLEFVSVITGSAVTNFSLDDVSLEVCTNPTAVTLTGVNVDPGTVTWPWAAALSALGLLFLGAAGVALRRPR